MKSQRPPISKRLRFDIFKRDGFLCQYCGRRPPDVVLELDHLHPHSQGGATDEVNLVTSCDDCNRGKGARLLRDIQPRPDADIAFLEIQQELSEARRFLATKEAKKGIESEVIAALVETWQTSFGGYCWSPVDAEFRRWFAEYSADEIDYAIRAAGRRQRSGNLDRETKKVVPYIWAILRNRRHEDQDA